MASTYSPNLRLELIGTGEQQGTWGSTTNTNLGTLLEEAIGGYVSVAVSDVADTTLTTSNGSADQSRNMVINLTGALTGTRNVICPAIEKLYVVKNATTGGQSIVFKVSGQTGITVPNGAIEFLYVDGTDARSITGTIASQDANNVSITGGSISGATVSNASLSNVSVVANASSLSVRDADGSNIMSVAVGSNLTANRVLTLTTGDADRTLDISASNVTISTAGAALIDDADASAQRTTLGLGTISTQNSNNVSVTGGSITGITDLALADGGTGASLTDPNADAVLGWNDTANVMRFFTAGTGISINATSNTISSTASTTGALIRAPQILTSGTSYTTPAGCTSIYVELVGGGGGSGAVTGGSNTYSGSGGGGAGGFAAKLFTVTPSTAYSYAIGAGGTAGSSGGSGGSGGATTFTVSGVVLTGNGGSGGASAFNSGSQGGAGGTASNGDLNVTGNPGTLGNGTTATSGANANGGTGGASFFGGAGRGGSNSTGSAGANGSGGGGSGTGNSTSRNGAAGGAGIIRIWEYT